MVIPKRFKKTVRIVFLALLIILPQLSFAHPHSWISIKSEFVLDEEGQLAELHQQWVFDVYFSMITLADVMNAYPDTQTGLHVLAEDVIANLKSYHYFATLNIDNQNIALPKPSQYEFDTAIEEEQPVLSFYMRFEFSEPLPTVGKRLTWRVFDPTYYIDMNHGRLSQIHIEAKNMIECSKNIETPAPSDEWIDYASSLDQSQRDTEGLGAHFAETVVILCV